MESRGASIRWDGSGAAHLYLAAEDQEEGGGQTGRATSGSCSSVRVMVWVCCVMAMEEEKMGRMDG